MTQIKTFAQKFKGNSTYQLRKLTKSIDLYTKDIYQKSHLICYANKAKGFGLMQPLALKNFSDIVCKHLRPVLGDNVNFFTLVTGRYCFGKNNWNFDFGKIQSETKKLLKGYSYIATVALEEFPKDRYLDEGILMEPHVHGIIWNNPTRWERRKIISQIKTRGYRINPLDIRSRDIESAVQYAFKACFGGKRSYTNKNGKRVFAPTPITNKSLYITFMKFKDCKIYDFAFAGRKGRKVLKNIIAEIENVKKAQ